MRIRFIFLCCFFSLIISGITTNGQTTADSLQILLGKSTGKEKVDILNKLAIEYRLKSLTTSIDYASEALKLSEDLGYEYGKGEAHKTIGIAYYLQGKYSEALHEYEQSHKCFINLGDQAKISAVLNNRAIIWVMQGEYERALQEYEKCVEINLDLELFETVAKIYNNIGMVYEKQGHIDKTIEYYYKSLELSEKYNNGVGKAAAYNNIALVQKTLGKYDVAIEYYHLALTENKILGDKLGHSRSLSNMASVYSDLGENDKAIELLKESIQIQEELNNTQGVIKSYARIGRLLIKLKNYNEAIKALENYLSEAERKNSKDEIIDAYYLLGIAHSDKGDTEEALEYYKKALLIADGIQFTKKIMRLNLSVGNCYKSMNSLTNSLIHYKAALELAEKNNYVLLSEDIYKGLSEVYSKLGEYKKAFNYQSKYIEIHEEIFNQKNQERIVVLQTKFEIERKEKEILQLKSEKQKSRQNSILIIGTASFLLLIIILLLLYNRYLIKKKSVRLLDLKNKQLTLAKDRAEESDRLKTAFLANISHEIRTPMNAIVGFSDFLIDPTVGLEEKTELHRIINLNSDILVKLIDDILDIARIESGQLKVKTEKVSVDRLINEIYELMKGDEALKSSGVHLNVYKPVRDSVQIYSDAFRLKQILINLLNNAIKFTKDGEVSFGYDVFELNGKRMITFNVKDTGVGIDKKFHDSVFDLFYKAPNDAKILYGGMGVGLSIAKNLVEQMGGEIWFKSNLDKGSTFFFTIPAESDSV